MDARFGLVRNVVGCFGDWMCNCDADHGIVNGDTRVVKQYMLSATMRKEEDAGPKR